MSASTYTVDTTGQIVAYGQPASVNLPNRVKIDTAGDILVGKSATDTLFPITAAEDHEEFVLRRDDQLFVKAASGTVVIVVHESIEYKRPDAIDPHALALAVKGTGGFWYDARTISSTTEQRLKNRVAEDTATEDAIRGSDPDATDSNSPLFLPHTGEHYIQLSGSSDDGLASVETPTPAGDFEFEVDLAIDDLRAQGGLLGQYTTGGNKRCWTLRLNASGNLTTYVSNDGSAAPNGNGTRKLDEVVSAGQRFILKGAYAFSVSGMELAISTSTDGGVSFQDFEVIDIVSFAFTQVFQGSVEYCPGARYLTNSTSPREVLNGRIYSATVEGVEVLNLSRDIDTTTDPDAGQSSFTNPDGLTWTVLRSSSSEYPATVVTRPVAVLDGTDDYLQLGDLVPNFTRSKGKFAVAVFYRIHTTPSNFACPISFESAVDTGLQMYISTVSGVTTSAVRSPDGNSLNTAGAVENNTLTMQAVSIDEGTLLMVRKSALSTNSGVNADLASTYTGDPVCAAGRFGTRNTTTSNRLAGELIGVLAYPDRSLTEDEMTALFDEITTGRFAL